MHVCRREVNGGGGDGHRALVPMDGLRLFICSPCVQRLERMLDPMVDMAQSGAVVLVVAHGPAVAKQPVAEDIGGPIGFGELCAVSTGR